jgi:uncharacterized protein
MKAKLVLALSLTAALAPAAMAQSLSTAPFIAAQGQARTEVVPDIFPLKVTLTETSLDASATQKKIESLASGIVATAREMAVSEDDITVGNLEIDVEQRYDEKTDNQVFVGNRYERVIRLRFHELASLKAFVDRLPVGRAVRAETGAFAYSKAEAERKKLLQEALTDARETADQVAAGLGKKIVGVHNASDQPLTSNYFGNGANLDAVSVSGSVALMAPGTVRGQSEMVLKKGVITLQRTIYVIYLLGN